MIDAFLARFVERLMAFTVGIVVGVAAPTKASCPTGWSLGEGVRRQGPRVGEYACHAPLPRCCGEPVHDGTGCNRACPPTKKYIGRIYCTGGMLPIVVNERTVACQARH